MKRRELVIISTTLPLLVTLPVIACFADNKISGEAERPVKKITLVRINSHDYSIYDNDGKPYNREDKNHYWATCIEDGDKFYYKVRNTTVEMSEDEYLMVLRNPRTYYFSTGLWLQLRIERAELKEREERREQRLR